MGDKTGISWTDATWNPIRGCSRVSAGCENCYAEKVAGRFSGPGLPYEGLARISKNGARWTGKIAVVDKVFDQPIRWARPRRVFVNSMSDLFHEKIPNETIAAIFGVMAAAPRHTFQILTKRAERMRDWFRWISSGAKQDCARYCVARAQDHGGVPFPSSAGVPDGVIGDRWPLPNVHLGVSAENQSTADERVPPLLECPAAIRFVSAEPMLGPIDFNAIQIPGEKDGLKFSALKRHHDDRFGNSYVLLDWIIVGGESGPGARPFKVSWARRIVEDCRASGTACFVKQMGSNSDAFDDLPFGQNVPDRKGGNPYDWPDDLRVQEFPTDQQTEPRSRP